MKRICLIIISSIIAFLTVSLNQTVNAGSLMSNKTEIPVNLEVSGAEALCQTEDGFVWIAQYSGLTRYDSRDFVTYKSYVENGVEHSILNVRSLASKGNTLFIATSSELSIYENDSFTNVDYNFGVLRDIIFDSNNDLLYISTMSSAYTYNVSTKTVSLISATNNLNIADIALDSQRNEFYYQTDTGVYDKDGNEILSYPKVLDIYSYDKILYIA